MQKHLGPKAPKMATTEFKVIMLVRKWNLMDICDRK
jgi:hypothetical protein